MAAGYWGRAGGTPLPPCPPLNDVIGNCADIVQQWHMLVIRHYSIPGLTLSIFMCTGWVPDEGRVEGGWLLWWICPGMCCLAFPYAPHSSSPKYRLYLDYDDKMTDFTVLVGCIFQPPVHLRLSSSFLLVYSHWILIKYVILTKQIIWPRNDSLIKSDSECNSTLKTLFRIILLSIIFHISVTSVSRAVQ